MSHYYLLTLMSQTSTLIFEERSKKSLIDVSKKVSNHNRSRNTKFLKCGMISLKESIYRVSYSIQVSILFSHAQKKGLTMVDECLVFRGSTADSQNLSWNGSIEHLGWHVATIKGKSYYWKSEGISFVIQFIFKPIVTYRNIQIKIGCLHVCVVVFLI